jgi:hypothetical protein
MTPELPASLMPTGSQRAALERRAAELDASVQAGPRKSIAAEVARLLATFAGSRASEGQAALRLNEYVEALEDQPAWAVAEARRRWNRGECGEHNYDFAPSPAVLRGIVIDLVSVTRGTAVMMRRLLNARPASEPMSEEAMKRAAAAASLVTDGLAKAKNMQRLGVA